eukprot:gene10748-12512_t
MVVVALASACTQDYECGSLPYSACRQRFNMYPGIGLDESAGKIFVLGKFNGTNGYFGNPYLASIPTGGAATLTPEHSLLSERSSGSGYNVAQRLWTYLSSTKAAWVQASMVGAPGMGPYSPTTGKISSVWTIQRYNLGAAFDQVNNRVYWCDVGVHRVNSIPKSYDDRYSTQLNLYDQQRCNYMGVAGNYIYMLDVTYETTDVLHTNIFRGTIDCYNCSQSSLVKIATLNQGASDFAMSSTKMYINSQFTGSGSIIEIPVSGDLTKQRTIVSEAVVSIALDNAANFLYYTTPAGAIKKVSLSGNHPQVTTLFNPNSIQGTCQCAQGFTGNCQTCTGGTVSWIGGQPICIPQVAGQPASCSYDWECGNVPFTWCGSGGCLCRQNFVGEKCDQCFGTITWEYGFPSCNV